MSVHIWTNVLGITQMAIKASEASCCSYSLPGKSIISCHFKKYANYIVYIIYIYTIYYICIVGFTLSISHSFTFLISISHFKKWLTLDPQTDEQRHDFKENISIVT